jgi:hypothetical protein
MRGFLMRHKEECDDADESENPSEANTSDGSRPEQDSQAGGAVLELTGFRSPDGFSFDI